MKILEVLKPVPNSRGLKVRTANTLDLTKLKDAEEDLLVEVLMSGTNFLYVTFNKVDVFSSGKGVLSILESCAERAEKATNDAKFGELGWIGDDITMLSASYNFATKTVLANFKLTFHTWVEGHEQAKMTPNPFKYKDDVVLLTSFYSVSAVPSTRVLRMTPTVVKGEQKTSPSDLDLLYLRDKLKQKGFFI